MTPNELRALAGKLRKLQAGEAYEAADYLRACADAKPVAVPAGWKLVPVEPTPEMLASTSWPGCAGTDYAHMLAAAPAAPQAEPQNIRERWNIERQSDGSLLVCFNLHEKGAKCEYEHFVPARQAEPKREPLTYEQLVSACYTYRHDFGLLDPDEQELVIEEAGRWAKAFGIGGSDE